MEILKNIVNISWNTYEIDATILVILVLLFKLYINRKATAIDYKRMFVSIPGEITFLVLGFLLSNMVTKISDSTSGQKNFTGILISLFVLVLQIAWEKDIDDKLSDMDYSVILKLSIMYIASVILYLAALKGGFGE